MSIRVIVHGGLGRMGSQSVDAALAEDGLEVVGIVDRLPDGARQCPSASIAYSTNVDEMIKKTHPDVMIDFSIAAAAYPAIEAALEKGVHVVSGTTGMAAEDIEALGNVASEHNVCFMTASNFAIGAVLMMSFAKTAAKYLDHAEIIELHHDKKLDAPSGTAITTANKMLQARPEGFTRPDDDKFKARGEDFNGIAVHSVRLPGYLAKQEVHFGALGQTLTITHNTITRDSFMPGVMLATKAVINKKGLINGLDAILDL